MARLNPLDPAPSVSLGEVEIIATQAGRTAKGLTASLQVLDGTGIFQDVVAIVVAKERRRFAEEAAGVAGIGVAEVEAKLLELARLIEVVLREPPRKREKGPFEASAGIHPEVAAERFGDFAEWRSDDDLYAVRNAQTYRVSHDKRSEEEYLIRLANFAARILEEIALDDGIDVARFYTIEGQLQTGKPLVPGRVAVQKFHAMSWPTEIWGFGPSIVAGTGAKDHMRVAIEEFSGTDVPRKTVFIHLGWRKVGKLWVFLHGGGAVGGKDVTVDVEGELQRYSLPDTSADVVDAVRLSLDLLDLGDPRITYPLWALVWRAPLCEWLPFLLVLWLLGETGTLKSTVAALVLSHFGGPFDKDCLPASWLDTDNRLEQRTFFAKDVPVVVDDFCPERNARQAQDLERRASRLIRAVGNRQARGRLRADLSARKSYFPRGLVVSTAEQLPNVAPSALARLLPVPFEKDAIDKAKLSDLQSKAHLLPRGLRGYLEHLAPQGDDLRERLRARFEELRGRARVEGHDRLPEAVAHLQVGAEMGVAFAVAVGALDARAAKEIHQRGWEVFMALAREHAQVLLEERPTTAFLRSLEEALASERAWLADRSTGKVAAGTAGAGSQKLGWVDAEGVYLLPETAYAFAADRLRHRGGVAISERALKKMLEKDRILARRERDRLESKPRCEGAPTWVLWLRRDALGELPGPGIRNTACHSCGSALSSASHERCPHCGWLTCHCGACEPGCERGQG